MRWPDLSATARALAIASARPISVSANASGARSRQTDGVKSGIDSGGIADGSAPTVATFATPKRANANATTAPTTMAVSMYGIRGTKRRPTQAPASVARPTMTVHGSICRTCAKNSPSARTKLGCCGTSMPKKLRSCALMISSPAPAVKPTITVVEMKLTSAPSRATPRPSLISPTIRLSVSTSVT